MAIKVSLPAPPTPSFDVDSTLSDTSSNRTSSTQYSITRCSITQRQRELESGDSVSKAKRITPFGIEFFGRVERTSLWFGTLLCALTWSFSQSRNATLSFALGCVVSVLMLRSQVWFVTSLVRPKSEGRASASKMLWVVQPLKYAILTAFLAWTLHAKILNPAVFAIGVSLSPFVIVAKAMGRVFAFNARPIAQVYGTQKPRTMRAK